MFDSCSGFQIGISKLQCRARHILRGGLQLNVGCADMVELFGHDVMRQFGSIAFAAQMGEIEMAQIGRHDLRGGFGGGFVGEMAVAAEDALLEAPGAARAFLHIFTS